MDENNELSDIVLNKNDSANSNKKIILAIATLGVVLIVVVMLMNSISSKGTNNLPQAVLPPEPKAQTNSKEDTQKEALFEDVPIVQENTQENGNLDNIAKKLKQESKITPHVKKPKEHIQAPIVVHKEKKHEPKVVEKPKKRPKVIQHKEVTPEKQVATKQETKKALVRHAYFIQVGSFSKYTPNKKFLDSITALGYHYSYHKMKNINKVLVGPFESYDKAKKAKAILRKKVVSGAFLIKL